MPEVIQPLVEAGRGWIRWRAAKRASLLGWLGVFAGQAIAGAVLFSVLLFALGTPFNAAAVYAGVFFALGCAISGVLFAMLWAFVFLQVIGTALGMGLGVWLNLPSWWRMAASEWDAGGTIPQMVVIIGLLLPPAWSVTCFVAHKGWIKVIDMVFSRLIASFTGRPSEADRRKEAAKDLKVSDSEADRAMRETVSEPEGLTVIGRSRIVRDDDAGSIDEDPEGESLYGSLAVEGNDEELRGLSESAAKSKQVVDASGAVVPGDPGSAASSSSSPSFTEDFSSAFSKEQAAKPSAPAPQPEVERDRIRSDDRNRLTFITDDYNDLMTRTSDESQALLEFMERHSETLLSLSDIELSFLNSLPDGAGRGVAQAAIQVQLGSSSVGASFESHVSAGLDDSAFMSERPTAGLADEDDEEVTFDTRPIYEDMDMSPEDEAGRSGADSPSEASEKSPAKFVAEFSFSGDEASKSLSGKRVASLLAEGAFASPTDRTEGFGGSRSDDGAMADEVEREQDRPVKVTAEPVEIDRPAGPVDPIARKMELVATGMSFDDATMQLERELREADAADQDAQAGSAAEMSADDAEIGTGAVESGGGDDAPSASSPEDVSDLSDDDEPVDEIFGFEVDRSVYEKTAAKETDGTSASDEDAVADEDVTDDGDVDPQREEGEMAPEIAGSDLDDEPAPALDVNSEGVEDVFHEEQEDNEMSIEAPLLYTQARDIFKIMNDTILPEEKVEKLLDLERMEGHIDTITASRSKQMIENFGEKTAHDLRNGIIALFRDFKDAEAVKFGEIAAEAEAKVISLRQAPHKIDSAKIGFLRSSVERMEGLLAGNSSTFAMEKKIRVSRIRTEVEELSAILDSQTAAVPKAVPASDEGRKKAADMIRRLSGEEVSVSTANESGAGAGDTDDDEEEVDMAAIASDDQDPASEQEDAQPWLDASLGDLDAPFAVIPEGVDINTPEGLAVLQERTALQARRVKAKEARDAFREKNAESDRIRAQQEGVEQARLAKAADLAQREEVLSENEADLQRRQQELAALREEAEREIESRRQAIEQEAARAVEDLSEERRQLEEEQERFGERAKVLDRLSDVFKEDVEKKVEIVRFVSDNMSGLFSVREVPHRFGQVSGMFMDLALARAIQKRVKGSSVGLQDALMSENSEGLPERIFPNKLNMAFHGATVFRKSAEIVHKLATELEVEVSVPSALDEEVDVQALIDACLDEEEKEFVSDVSSWMKSSRTEFFEMTKAVEENAHDFRMARKVESSNMQDVEQLAQANAALKLRLDEAEKELGAVRADLKQAQAQIQARPARPGGAVSEEVQGHVDSGTVAMEINEMFTKEGFSRNRGKSLLEVGQRKVVVGLLDGNAGLPSKKKVMAELEAGSHLPVIVFTNAPPEEQDDISGHLAEFANVAISFQPLAMEDAREFMLEEIRKLDDE